jgi:molybdopterin-binding protein
MSGALTVEGLRFSYAAEPVDALIAIDELALDSGQVTVITGNNGCGKTTLLKLLAGILKPEVGRIVCADGVAPILVHQRPYLFAESVRANVAWPLKIRGGPRKEIRDRVTVALEQVGLAHLERRWALSLSGGERQRTAIARALVLEPRVLLLDEPTSNIDAASVVAVEGVLRTAAAAGTTVVMSTHNIASAYRLADRILPMSGGRLVPSHLNVLRGLSVDSGGEPGGDPAGEHIGRFCIDGGVEIFCPARVGSFTRAVIRMEDIILSPSEMTSSARNHLQGQVTAVDAVGDELVQVGLDCGFPLVARVTHRSRDELALTPGSTVYATFKASAVELY